MHDKFYTRKGTILVSSLIFILSLLAKFSINLLRTSPFSHYEFIALTLIKICLITVVLMFLRSFNIFAKDFFLKNSKFYFVLSLVLVFWAVKSSIKDLEVLSDLDRLQHSFFLTYYLAVGVFEELFFRILIFGFFIRLFPKKNVFYTMLITSSFFALFHVLNLFDSNVIKVSVINQILYAFAVGLIFQSLLIKLKNIIFIATLHGLLNYKMMFATEFLGKESTSGGALNAESFISSLILFVLLNLLIALPISYLTFKTTSMFNYIK